MPNDWFLDNWNYTNGQYGHINRPFIDYSIHTPRIGALFDSVYTFAHALDKLLKTECRNMNGFDVNCCVNGENLLSHLKTVSFEGKTIYKYKLIIFCIYIVKPLVVVLKRSEPIEKLRLPSLEKKYSVFKLTVKSLLFNFKCA